MECAETDFERAQESRAFEKAGERDMEEWQRSVCVAPTNTNRFYRFEIMPSSGGKEGVEKQKNENVKCMNLNKEVLRKEDLLKSKKL